MEIVYLIFLENGCLFQTLDLGMIRINHSIKNLTILPVELEHVTLINLLVFS
jgi:hypothetical protein